MSEDPGIKTDEKKQHFDDIYVAPTPVPFKERIIDALDYVSDDFNRQTFDRLILPWCERQGGRPIPFVDLCACFGNTTLAVGHDMSTEQLRENWKDEASARQPLAPRRFNMDVTGIDISANALSFGQQAGIFDHAIEADLNHPSTDIRKQVDDAMSGADVVISTASLVYLETDAIEWLVASFAKPDREGYALVNFLNPFALEKADQTKRILLEHLDFVGSMASRHRRLSAIEQENYPGEEWALLEIWVLKRRGY